MRRPKHELGLGATLRTFDGRGTVSADARYVAGNYDSQFFGTFATAQLPDYWKVDLAATYDVTDNLSLNARVDDWPAAGFVDGNLSFHSSLLECDRA